MIDDLDNTLKKILERELPPELVAPEATTPVTISFETPDDQFRNSVTLPAINLFLYDVRENRDLRTNEWIVEKHSDGAGNKQRAPIRVECSYLVTAWAADSAPKASEDEHRLLSEVMIALLRHPIIPPEVLQGRLKEQAPMLPAISLHPGRLQSLGEFWQALGGKPKAALNYTVTIGVVPQKPIETKVVTEKMLKFRIEKEVAP
jgi:hypothetical protein